MTKVSTRKTKLSFETDAEIRSWGSVTVEKKSRRRPLMRSVIVDVDNGWHGSVRLKGTRQSYEFSWHGLFMWAVEQHVARERAEKKKAKAAKAGGR